jgi:hypothetical protein
LTSPAFFTAEKITAIVRAFGFVVETTFVAFFGADFGAIFCPF